MYIETTITLRKDIYQILKRETRTNNLSNKINEILADALLKKEKDLFGTMLKTDIKDLRDHEDRL